MKMYDVGHKPKKTKLDEPIEMGSEMRYPQMYDITSDQFPGVKDMQAGKEVKMMIHAKPSRISIDKDGKVTACLQITKMGMEESGKKSKVDSMMDKMYPEKKEED